MAPVLNFYNFRILTCILFCFSPRQTLVFQTKIYMYLIYSYVIYVIFSTLHFFTWLYSLFEIIGYFTVMDGSEAGVGLVLIQTFLLYYVNQVILMLTSIFLRTISIKKQRRFVSKQGHGQPRIHLKARVLSPHL